MKRILVVLFFAACFLTLEALSSISYAGIVLKVIAINPSKEQSQKVNIKAYLPKETKPEDILDKGDLEVAYDTQQGSYYVYGDYELKPGESTERSIELRDIWVVPASELESLREESNKLATMLKNTEFSERITFLCNSIESKLNQVSESQNNAPANPEKHISEYRDNLRLLESVKADLALARNLSAQAKPVSAGIIWKSIVAILIFLALLGVAFFLVWQKQAKLFGEDFASLKDKDDAAFSSVEPLKKEEKKE